MKKKTETPYKGVIATTDDSERPSTVIDLSSVALNEDEIHLLSKGLSFCPTPHHLNKKELLDDLESFFRC